MVTPLGLKAWSKLVRSEERGGGVGEGILGWHRRAISAYTCSWRVTGKGLFLLLPLSMFKL